MEEKSRIPWKAGDTAVIKPGWDRFGVTFRVLGPAVFSKQWWVPIEDPEEDDPTFFKEAGLELFVSEMDYVPASLREVESPLVKIMYAIGELDENEDVGMWAGPQPNLMEMLDVPGMSHNSILLKYLFDGTHEFMYRWVPRRTCWIRAQVTEIYVSEEDYESQM